ncbi:hypothetical protein [Paludisphaera rhizosphaerae]|uniref:hypothetical protein n=1 Tax=Paludisphaera rhizosphaerae TaxID=2711216 RepID=UPI001F0DC9F1|nr:hypothetical protein [Paludisphaera rhizosphaerae]
MGLGGGAAIEVGQAIGLGVEVEPFVKVVPRGLAELASEIGVVKQAEDGVGQGRRIVGGTSRPDFPGRIRPRSPRTSAATQGTPCARASVNVLPALGPSEGWQ